MAKRRMTEREHLEKQASREMSIYKRDDMVQKSRHQLSAREQKCVLFAISKIKPTDEAFNEYVFELKDFYAACGLDSDSYTAMKNTLKGLADKSWWTTLADQETESMLRWFSSIRINKRTGKVAIKFHEDLVPYLLRLSSQKAFFTSYNLQYILPMNSQFSPRLYELLKSYQKNNLEWFFEIDELKRLLGAQNYQNYADFKKRVLDPAVEEINQYTDINVAFDDQREGRGGRVTRVTFYMANKTPAALTEAKISIGEKLDGQVTMEEIADSGETVREQFRRNNPVVKKENKGEWI